MKSKQNNFKFLVDVNFVPSLYLLIFFYQFHHAYWFQWKGIIVIAFVVTSQSVFTNTHTNLILTVILWVHINAGDESVFSRLNNLSQIT